MDAKATGRRNVLLTIKHFCAKFTCVSSLPLHLFLYIHQIFLVYWLLDLLLSFQSEKGENACFYRKAAAAAKVAP